MDRRNVLRVAAVVAAGTAAGCDAGSPSSKPLNGDTLKVSAFLPTGQGAHGLYPSRDSRYLYFANRGEAASR